MQINTYKEWKYCIEVSCGILLTKSFINGRLTALTNNANKQTQEFIKLYGFDYTAQIILWFQKAEAEILKQA